MKIYRGKKYGLLLVLLLSTSSAMGAVSFDWAVIGNAGNAADDTGYGAVDYEYSIATTEVTTAQYVEFLNAVAATDTHGLYNSDMGSSSYYSGISRTMGLDGYVYSANAGWENRPVAYVSWYDTLRFANWLHNGQQGQGTTEYGAYDMSLQSTNPASIVRLSGATYWLPSEDEWYKAAYYSPAGVYYDYATGSNYEPTAGVDANYYDGGYAEGSPYYSTEVGEYDNESPYGTYDQNGNVYEWNETAIGPARGMRGGSWYRYGYDLLSGYRYYNDTTYEDFTRGFRVAGSGETTVVPEPMSVGLVLLSVGGLLLRRAKRA